MTETEKRRSELLAQTRARYSEKSAPPAIHPRYQNAYYSLYPEARAESDEKRGSFGVRMLLAVLLLALFALADYRKMDEVELVTKEIAREHTALVDFTFLD
ncbi:MAG: hypothetical protein UHS49_06090 [Faecalimonas sp.]|nr:hypothetical protein [Faecalimonas sp.]